VQLFAVDLCSDKIVVRDVTHNQNVLMSIVVRNQSGRTIMNHSARCVRVCGADDPSMQRIGKVRNAAGFKMFSMVEMTDGIVHVQKYMSDSTLVPYITVRSSPLLEPIALSSTDNCLNCLPVCRKTSDLQVERSLSLSPILLTFCGMSFNEFDYRVTSAGGTVHLADVHACVHAAVVPV
jgi:hypothetical protein